MSLLARVFLFLLLMLSLAPGALASVNKKNLCTITLNSSEEAELFKKHLSPDSWNFIELAPSEGSQDKNKNWFQQACRKNISCDILVVSGHFAGSFFGKSKFNLSIEELEERSCEQACDGILHRPKEVFLFGCNTLASKDTDSRTPEQYMRVLLQDGFSAAQASQVVSFRYSGLGDSFKSRMSSVFAKTPRIYGFSSIGPSGKTIEPLLGQYLKSTESYYENFDFGSAKASLAKNKNLFSSLKNTSVAQSTGHILNMKTSNEKPYCYINSEKVNRLAKIKYVEEIFKSGKSIQMISHIERFFYDLNLEKNTLTEEEKNALLEITQNQKIKQDFLELLKLKSDIYIPLKVHVLNTLKYLQIVSDDFIESAFNKVIDLKKPFTLTKKDMLCSSNFSMNIPASLIPEKRWSEINFLITLMCLKPTNADLHFKMLEQMSSADPAIRGTAIWFFYDNKIKTKDIQKALTGALLNDSEFYIRQSAIQVLASLQSEISEIHLDIAQALIQEKNKNVVATILLALESFKLNSAAEGYIRKNINSSAFKDLISNRKN